MVRRDYFRTKRGPVSQVYNAGTVTFFEKQVEKDKYGTIIGSVNTEVYKDWYRKLGVTAEDIHFAHADSKELTRKVAIKGDRDIDTKWSAQIGDKEFEVYRVFYAYRNNETEISLVEVV